MKKFLALVSARNKEFYRDKATLGWTFVFPFIVLSGFTYGYSGKSEPSVRVGLIQTSLRARPVIQNLAQWPSVQFEDQTDLEKAVRKIEKKELDLILSEDSQNEVSFRVDPASDKGMLGEKILGEVSKAHPETHFKKLILSSRTVRYSDWLLPGLLAMNIMFGSMFGVGYVLVRYRKNGVLKRLRATPLTAFEFLVSQILSRMLLMVVTGGLLLSGAMLIIGFRPAGSVLTCLCFLAISAISLISLGLVVAARISSEEVADGILNVMTWPMIFLSGIWFSLDGASPWVHFLSQLMPLKHVVDGLRAILIDGASLAQVAPQIFILTGLAAVFLAIGTAIFRWR